MTLKAFFEKYPRFSSLASVPGIKELYDFLCRPSTIDSLIHVSENRRPAISAITRNIEAAFHDKKTGKDGMNFKKNVFLKLFIGSVISLIMKGHGYIKDRNKNLNPQESDYFSAGTLYVKDESNDELKEKAREFWKAHSIGEKVIKILENWNQLSGGNYTSSYRVGTYSSLKNTSMDFWPYSWIIDKHYGSRLFVSTHQIAIELERQYPGIIALSELEAFEFGAVGYQKSYRFFTMIFDNLPVYAKERKIRLEIAELPDSHGKAMELSYEGLKIFSRKTNWLWRITKSGTADKSEIKRTIENVTDEWCIKTFDEQGILDAMKTVLKESVQEVEGKKNFKFMSLHQLSLSISRVKNLSNHVSFALLFKELVRRIWREEINNIELEFLSGRDMSSLSYNSNEVSGLSKYIPLFKYKS